MDDVCGRGYEAKEDKKGERIRAVGEAAWLSLS